MNWKPIKVPVEHVMPFGDDEQANKPLGQRLAEAETSTDPLTSVFGDHMRVSAVTDAYSYHYGNENGPITEFLALLIRPLGALPIWFLLLSITVGANNTTNYQIPVAAQDEESAKTDAERIAFSYIRDFASNLDEIAKDLNGEPDSGPA